MGIQAGDEAPDFELRDQNGEPVRLSSFRGDKAVVVMFYPFAFSRVCTGEPRRQKSTTWCPRAWSPDTSRTHICSRPPQVRVPLLSTTRMAVSARRDSRSVRALPAARTFTRLSRHAVQFRDQRQSAGRRSLAALRF